MFFINRSLRWWDIHHFVPEQIHWDGNGQSMAYAPDPAGVPAGVPNPGPIVQGIIGVDANEQKLFLFHFILFFHLPLQCLSFRLRIYSSSLSSYAFEFHFVISVRFSFHIN